MESILYSSVVEKVQPNDAISDRKPHANTSDETNNLQPYNDSIFTSSPESQDHDSSKEDLAAGEANGRHIPHCERSGVADEVGTPNLSSHFVASIDDDSLIEKAVLDTASASPETDNASNTNLEGVSERLERLESMKSHIDTVCSPSNLYNTGKRIDEELEKEARVG